MRRGKRSASFIIVNRLPRSRLAAHTYRRSPWPRKLPTVSPSRCVCGGSDVAAWFSSTNTINRNNNTPTSADPQGWIRPEADQGPEHFRSLHWYPRVGQEVLEVGRLRDVYYCVESSFNSSIRRLIALSNVNKKSGVCMTSQFRRDIAVDPTDASSLMMMLIE